MAKAERKYRAALNYLPGWANDARTGSDRWNSLHLHLDEIGAFFDERLSKIARIAEDIGFWRTVVLSLLLLGFGAFAVLSFDRLVFEGLATLRAVGEDVLQIIRLVATLGVATLPFMLVRPGAERAADFTA